MCMQVRVSLMMCQANDRAYSHTPGSCRAGLSSEILHITYVILLHITCTCLPFTEGVWVGFCVVGVLYMHMQ
jgi:hypothetical protein